MAVVLGVPGVDGRWWEDFGVKGGSSRWLDDWLDGKLDGREAGRRLRSQKTQVAGGRLRSQVDAG
jgi:hypothetical protein